MGFVPLPRGPTFCIRLKDHSQIGLFEVLCRDVVASAEAAEEELDALNRAVGRTSRWHHLLRGGHSNLLSEEEQRGLIGELIVLDRLAEVIGSRAAIMGWKGPSGAPKDFELRGHCIEVKTRRTAAQPFIQISNEFQLADVAHHRLWLTVLAVERVADPFGEPLNALVSRVGKKYQSDDAMMAMDWELNLAATGYRDEDDYSAFRWVSDQPTWLEVAGDFPRITTPLPGGVSNVKYALALEVCSAFEVEARSAEGAISEGYTNE
jgi:hypothetical protein